MIKKILAHPATHLLIYASTIMVARLTLENKINSLLLLILGFLIVIVNRGLYMQIEYYKIELKDFISQRMSLVNALACYILMFAQIYVHFIKK